MTVVVLPTPEDVGREVVRLGYNIPSDGLDGSYIYARGRHVVFFAEETLTRSIVVHEAVHIGLRNMQSPSSDFEEDLALRIEMAYEVLATALLTKGLLPS